MNIVAGMFVVRPLYYSILIMYFEAGRISAYSIMCNGRTLYCSNMFIVFLIADRIFC